MSEINVSTVICNLEDILDEFYINETSRNLISTSPEFLKKIFILYFNYFNLSVSLIFEQNDNGDFKNKSTCEIYSIFCLGIKDNQVKPTNFSNLYLQNKDDIYIFPTNKKRDVCLEIYTLGTCIVNKVEEYIN